jgi:sulfide:quinone oxidoreductase
VFADEQARTVAARIVAEASGAEGAPQYSGRGFCYIEVGEGRAAYGAGNFYAMPAPSVAMEEPSPRFRREKAEQERALLAAWE